MSAPPLAAFGTAGGAPPATLESLRVLPDGRARAIVGSAWPAGAPQDEAGLYETRLAQAELEALQALAGDRALRALEGEHGPIRADSGRSSLSLSGAGGEQVEIAWGAFAELPAPLPAAVAALRRILAAVREHPVAALRLAIEAEGEPGPEGVGLAFTLANPGRERVRHSLLLDGAERPRVAFVPTGSPGDPPALSTYRAAVPVVLDEPLRDDALAAGEERRLRATAPLEPAPGAYALVAFARGTLKLVVDGRPLGLDLFLISRPLAIEDVRV